MTDIAYMRCANHGAREAAGRCPECAEDFCRECLTEHKGRVICAACLSKKNRPLRQKGHTKRTLLRAVQCVAALGLLWICFYASGRALLTLPDSFHDGTFWTDPSGIDP